MCVRYLRTSWSSIGNRMIEHSEQVRFVIQTNECVNTVCIHFPWCFMFIIYIPRFKFLFSDKLCCTHSSQKLIKDISYIYVTLKCFDCRHFLVNSKFIVDDTHHRVAIFRHMPLNTLNQRFKVEGSESINFTFCWLHNSVHFSLVVLFVSQKFSQQLHISLLLLFCFCF